MYFVLVQHRRKAPRRTCRQTSGRSFRSCRTTAPRTETSMASRSPAVPQSSWAIWKCSNTSGRTRAMRSPDASTSRCSTSSTRSNSVCLRWCLSRSLFVSDDLMCSVVHQQWRCNMYEVLLFRIDTVIVGHRAPMLWGRALEGAEALRTAHAAQLRLREEYVGDVDNVRAAWADREARDGRGGGTPGGPAVCRVVRSVQRDYSARVQRAPLTRPRILQRSRKHEPGSGQSRPEPHRHSSAKVCFILECLLVNLMNPLISFVLTLKLLTPLCFSIIPIFI